MSEDDNYKKFVFKINDENIHFIESLHPDERNDFINEIIAKYSKKYRSAKDFFEDIKRTKRVSTVVGLIIIMIPTMYIMHIVSKSLTEINFNIMTNHFVNLFNQRAEEISEFEILVQESVKQSKQNKAAQEKNKKKGTHKTVSSPIKNNPHQALIDAMNEIETEGDNSKSALGDAFKKSSSKS